VSALFVGVDGGGTSTRCVVAGETGEIAGRGRAGGANAVSVPDPAGNLLAALLAALGGLDGSQVAGGVFGLAGTAAAGRPVAQAWQAAGLPGSPVVVPDMLVAFTSASTEPDGTVLVAGTGAVAARIHDRRVVRRADGRGWLLGDEGSGVWIGRQAAIAVLAAVEGRAAPTALVARIAAAVLGAGDRPGYGDTPPREGGPGLAEEIVAAVYAGVARSGPAWLATLAPLVDAAAREGDQVAREILHEGARLLCRTARWASGDGPAGPLVLAGSLLTEPTELSRLVRTELDEQGVAGERVAAGDGAAGAAALALRAALPPGDPRALDGHRALIGQGEA
jgi:N-acetylglucosamine kinase-like BadF-type ATPase